MPNLLSWGARTRCLFYVGPEGGWTSLSNQKDTITTTPFRVDSGLGLNAANGPFFSNFNGSARYDSGFNAGGRLGLQYGPCVSKKNTVIGTMGCRVLAQFFGPGHQYAFTGERNTHSIMTNFIYDFTIGWPVTPHIGFGIGAVDNVDSISLNPVTLNGSGPDDGQRARRCTGQDRGRDAFPEPDSWRHLPEGKQLEFRLSGDCRFPLRHQPVARL